MRHAQKSTALGGPPRFPPAPIQRPPRFPPALCGGLANMDSMQRRSLPRSVLYVLAAFLVLIVVGSVIPQIVISTLKPVAIGTEHTYRSAPSTGLLFDAAAYQDARVPVPNRTKDECANTTASSTSTTALPLNCFVVPVELKGERITRTSAGKNKKYAAIDTQVTLRATPAPLPNNTTPAEGRGVDKVVMALQDKAVLIRHSGYAEPEPTSNTHFELPFAGVDMQKDNYVRDGLQYVFPFTAKRISYPYWDVVADRATPLDYVDPVELPNGLITWDYAQTLEGLPLDTELTFRGKASQFFTPEEQATRNLRADSAVTLVPFYSVTRTVQLEPKTGIMTNYSVDMSVVLDLAAPEGTAEGAAEGDAETPESAQSASLPERRTLFSGSQAWDAATQQEALDRIQPVVTQLKVFQVLSYICSILTMLLVLWSAWRLIRWRRRYVLARTTGSDSDIHTND